jgi:hypothetical protein
MEEIQDIVFESNMKINKHYKKCSSTTPYEECKKCK